MSDIIGGNRGAHAEAQLQSNSVWDFLEEQMRSYWNTYQKLSQATKRN